MVQPPTDVSVSPEQASVEGLISQGLRVNASVETMEKLMAMRREIRAERSKEAFDAAMAQFQSECPIITKEKVVKDKYGAERYRYAPLDSIVGQVKNALAKNGFSYYFDEIKDDKYVAAVCTVTHVQGFQKQSTFKVEIGNEEYMTNTQKYGARMTFAKRYAFCNAFGIMTGDEDTDANDTEEEKTQPEAKPTGNPGGITKAQLDTVEDLVQKLGGTIEELEGKIIQTQKKSISELSLESGKKLIDALRKRLALKEAEGSPEEVTDEDVAEIERIMEKPLVDEDSSKPKKQCPFCDQWHTGDFPKCKECWRKEQNGEKLVPKGKTKTITNPDEPPFESKARPGETIH